MRALVLFITTALAACTPAAQPAPQSPAPTDAPATETTTAADATTPESAEPTDPAPAESKPVETVELTRGKRVELHGLRVMLRSAGTEHRADSLTVNRAELEVKNGDEEQKISLEREEPGEAKFVEVFGLELGLESVDASRKPSTAKILVRP